MTPDHSSDNQLIRIGQTADQAQLTKTQKEFNQLTQKIETLEKELTAYQEAMQQVQQQIAGEYQPLVNEYQQQRASLVRLLDRAYESGSFKSVEKKKLADLILGIAFELIANAGLEELKPIYDKYDRAGFDATQAEENDQTTDDWKEAIRALLGVEPDEDVDWSSPEKIQAYLDEKMAQDQAYAEAQRERHASRKRTAKQQAREDKRQTEALNIAKSVRTIYMDLVKAFHPDREPDEAEKERKTGIMQRVTEAYEKSDLMALLRLQLEFNRIDQNHLEKLTDERLVYYNKLLKQRTNELKEQLSELQQQASLFSQKPLRTVLSSASLSQILQQDIQTLKKEIRVLRNDILALEEVSVLRQWLKSYQIR